MKLHVAVYCIIKNINHINDINIVNKYYEKKQCNTIKKINEYILNTYNIYISLKNNKTKLLNKHRINGKNIILSKIKNDYFLLFNKKNKLIRYTNNIKGGAGSVERRTYDDIREHVKLRTEQLYDYANSPAHHYSDIKHDHTNPVISFGSFKTNLILNNLQNIETFIKNDPYDYLANIFSDKNYDIPIRTSRTSRTSRISRTSAALSTPKDIKIEMASAPFRIRTDRTRHLLPARRLYSRTKSLTNRKYSTMYGGDLNDIGKIILKVMHIFDKKHDFGKARNGKRLSKNNLDKLNENGVKFITKTVDRLLGTSPQRANILKDLLELYNNSINYETKVLLYVIEKLIKGDLYGENISSLFAFYLVKNIKFVDSSDTALAEFKIDIYEKLSKFILDFLEISSINKDERFYVFDTIIQINKGEKNDEEGETSSDKRALSVIQEETDEINTGDDDEDDEDEDEEGDETQVLSSAEKGLLRWSVFTSEVLDKNFKKCIPIESGFDPNSSGKISVPSNLLGNIYEITSNVYNSINTDASIEYDTAFRNETKKYFRVEYYNPDPSNRDKFWVSLLFNKPMNNDYGFTDTDDMHIIQESGNINGIAWNGNGFGVPLLITYINLLSDTDLNLTDITKYGEYIRRNKEHLTVNSVLQFVIAYLYHNNVDNKDIISILYDFKKSGDWGQILYCKFSDKLNTKTSTLFVSGDKLCSLYSLLQQSVKTLFGIDQTFLNKDIATKDKTFVMGLYKGNKAFTIKDLLNDMIKIFNLDSDYFDMGTVPNSGERIFLDNINKNIKEELLADDNNIRNLKIILEILVGKIRNINEIFTNQVYYQLMDDVYFTPNTQHGDGDIIDGEQERPLFNGENIKLTYNNMFQDIIAIINNIILAIDSIDEAKKSDIINLFKDLNRLLHNFDNLDKIIRICFCKYTTTNKSFLYVVLLQLKQNLDNLVIVDIDAFIQNMISYKKKSIDDKIRRIHTLPKMISKKETIIKKHIEKLEKYEIKIRNSSKILSEPVKQTKTNKKDKSATPGIIRIGTIDKKSSKKSLSAPSDIYTKQKVELTKKLDKAKDVLKKYKTELKNLPTEIDKATEEYNSFIESRQQVPKKSRRKTYENSEIERGIETDVFDTDLYRRGVREDKELNYFKNKIAQNMQDSDLTFANILRKINPGKAPSVEQEIAIKNLFKILERHMDTVKRDKVKLRGIQKEGLFVMIVENMMSQLLQNIQGDFKKELDILIDQIDFVSNEKYKLFIDSIKKYYRGYIEEIIPDTDLYARYISNIQHITNISKSPYENSTLLKVKYYYEHIFKLLYK